MQSRIFRKVALAAVALAGFAAAKPASAAVQNGSFEAFPDFAGFTLAGNGTVRDATFFQNPTNGTVQAVLQSGFAGGGSGTPVSATTLETQLGLAPGSLSNAGNGAATTGTAISQSTITANANDVISFDVNFLTNEGAGGAAVTNNDFAFYSITPAGNGAGGSGLPATGFVKINQATDALSNTSANNQASSGLSRESGYRRISVSLPTSGTFTLGFGVVNVGDNLGNSALLVDNITQAPGVVGGAVPLPMGVMLAPLGAGVAALFARRMRKQQA